MKTRRSRRRRRKLVESWPVNVETQEVDVTFAEVRGVKFRSKFRKPDEEEDDEVDDG